ncbi:DUF4347 domain-containing protein [Roseiconus lacunae]|uniref:DUF4347 domain-containing protein n=1 Tax=Roseiconus lacunae TaxID=2605694 RepID=UPI003090DFAD|nr:DUF4347 domain-containing protein [Stieleria sp. HD01]
MFWHKKPTHPDRRRPKALDVVELTPRLMFSASPITPVVGGDVSPGIEEVLESPTTDGLADNGQSAAQQASSSPTDDVQSVHENEQGRRLELVFIDSAVDDYQTLVDEIATEDPGRELQIYLLDHTRDGVDQVTEILEGYENVDAIHLLSHGNDAKLRLGNAIIDQHSLDGYAADLSQWQSSLNENADLLLYGCELAESGSGRTLVAALAELTGADVAASDDDTGHASLDGNWELEHRVGVIESTSIADTFGGQSWFGLLSTPDINPTGETRVNDTHAQDQELQDSDQAVAVDGNGNSVVVWVDHHSSNDDADLYFQRFDSTGAKIGGETKVNAGTTGDQSSPVVTMDSSGRFAIAWVSSDIDGQGIYVRRFDQTGAAIDADDILVNTFAEAGNQSGVSIASNDNNQIVLAWESDGANEGIFARTFDFTSVPALDSLSTSLLTVDTVASASDVAIDINQTGRYAIVWRDSGNSYGIQYNYGAVTPTDSKRDLNGIGGGTEYDYAVGMLSNNDYVVTFRSEATFFKGVWYRLVPESGSIWVVARATSDSTAIDPSIDVDQNDRFVISYTKSDADDVGVYYQAFDDDGSKIGSEVAVNTTTSGTQELASIAMHDTDNVVVVWSGNGAADSQGVFLRYFGAPNVAPVADPNAGSAYVISEGGSLSLDGSDSSDANGDTLTYAWDIDNDGVFGETNEPTSATATLSWATLQSFGIDDDGVYTIGLRVSDGRGGIHTQTTTVTVNNVAPTITVTGATEALQGNAYTINLAASDAGDDSLTGWQIDWGDGTITLHAGAATSATHTYSVEGLSHNILVSATDEDGTWHYGDVFVGSEESNPLARYDTLTGTFETNLANGGSLDKTIDFAYGSDGLLYVTGWGSDNVLRFNPQTGAYVDEFVVDGSGGISKSAGIAFGPDGHLYVADYDGDRVLKYDGSVGTYLGEFVAAGSGGLEGPMDLWFHKDGHLYVVGNKSDNILRYDASTGAFVDEFVSDGAGGLDDPISMAFGRDGRLYVSSQDTNSIKRFDQGNGSYIDDFVTSGSGGLDKPRAIAFGPDDLLYVSSSETDEVLRYDVNGNYVDAYISGVTKPRSFIFAPSHQVTVTSANSDPTATNTSQIIAYNEDDASVAIADIVVSEADAGDTITATLTLNLPATGALTTGTFGSATSTYSTGTGVWTVTGSVADVNAALADVAFTPTENNATPSQISVSIEDAAGAGPADGLIQLNVTPENDRPTLDLDDDDSSTATGGDFQTMFTEGGGAISIVDHTDAVISDIDDANLDSMTVTITNLSDGAFETLSADTTGTGIVANYAAGILTLSGSDSVSNYQQVLRTVRYINTASDPTEASRIVTFVADDGTATSNVVTSTIQVTAVNDPPVITNPGTQTANEDTILNISGIAISDADLGSGLIEVTFTVANGKLRINPFVASGVSAAEMSGNNSRTITIRSTLARLNTTLSTAGVNYIGDSHYNGSDSLQIQADDSVNVTTAAVPINVAAVNDAPTATNDRYQTSRDEVLHVLPNGVLQNDSDIEGDSLSTVLISGPQSGSLVMGGNGGFVYTPGPATSGLVTFTYAVSDGSHLSNHATVQILVTVPVLPPQPDVIDQDPTAPEPPAEEASPETESDTTNDTSDNAAPVVMVPQTEPVNTKQESRASVALSEDDSSDFDFSAETRVAAAGGFSEHEDELHYKDTGLEYGMRQRLDARTDAASLTSLSWGQFDSMLVWEDIAKIQQQINSPTETTYVMAGTFAGFSSALSVGYVVWTVRGGLLATSLLAHLPAWSFVDPLLVLSDLEGEGDDADDDSLENIIDKNERENSPEGTGDETKTEGNES